MAGLIIKVDDGFHPKKTDLFQSFVQLAPSPVPLYSFF